MRIQKTVLLYLLFVTGIAQAQSLAETAMVGQVAGQIVADRRAGGGLARHGRRDRARPRQGGWRPRFHSTGKGFVVAALTFISGTQVVCLPHHHRLSVRGQGAVERL